MRRDRNRREFIARRQARRIAALEVALSWLDETIPDRSECQHGALMPPCLFCKRDDVPRVPLFPIAISALVAHVDTHGAPCHEGAAQETHSRMLGPDYPHEGLLGDDEEWDLDSAVLVTARPVDPTVVFARHLAEEQVTDLADVEPAPLTLRPARRPRKRRGEP